MNLSQVRGNRHERNASLFSNPLWHCPYSGCSMSAGVGSPYWRRSHSILDSSVSKSLESTGKSRQVDRLERHNWIRWRRFQSSFSFVFFSFGPCQFPTLGFVVERQGIISCWLEIKLHNFWLFVLLFAGTFSILRFSPSRFGAWNWRFKRTKGTPYEIVAGADSSMGVG